MPRAPLCSSLMSTLMMSDVSGLSPGSTGAACWVAALGLTIDGFVGCRHRRGARPRERFNQRHLAGEDVRAGVPDLSHDEDALAAVLLDGHADLRVLEEPAVCEPLPEFGLELPQRQPGGLYAADVRKREAPVGLDGELPRGVRLVPHRDHEHVLRADHVVEGWRGVGLRLGPGLRLSRRAPPCAAAAVHREMATSTPTAIFLTFFNNAPSFLTMVHRCPDVTTLPYARFSAGPWLL